MLSEVGHIHVDCACSSQTQTGRERRHRFDGESGYDAVDGSSTAA
jgi:hypothetical protein